MKNSIKRNYRYDVFKVIGLLCIILAHVEPGNLIRQIREFDIVLMILISCFLNIDKYKGENIFKYLFKRINRLVIPTWIFIIIFYFLNCIFRFRIISLPLLFDSFILNQGIGYIWIIRIYILIALLFPLYHRINKILLTKTYILSFILLLINELFAYIGLFNSGKTEYLFGYIIPVFFLISISYYLHENSNCNDTIDVKQTYIKKVIQVV